MRFPRGLIPPRIAALVDAACAALNPRKSTTSVEVAVFRRKSRSAEAANLSRFARETGIGPFKLIGPSTSSTKSAAPSELRRTCRPSVRSNRTPPTPSFRFGFFRAGSNDNSLTRALSLARPRALSLPRTYLTPLIASFVAALTPNASSKASRMHRMGLGAAALATSKAAAPAMALQSPGRREQVAVTLSKASPVMSYWLTGSLAA